MAERCDRLPSPVVRRIALGRLGFHYDRHAGAWVRDALAIAEETLDTIGEEDFHRCLHTWAGEERCMAVKVVANSPFQYGPPVGVAGETLALERGRVLASRVE